MTKSYATITADVLASDLAQGRVAEFWNVLAEDYFKGEMIPGSRRVPVDQVAREAITERIAKDTPIVTYCSGPACPNSGQAAAKLVTLGFTNVRAFEGGVEEWRASGRTIEQLAGATA